MKLYHARGACPLAVHIALREAGSRFDLHQVNLATHRLADGSDYHAVNPRGYVPLLELDDGSRHTEVAALLQYVGDLDPSHRLLPAGGRERLVVVEALAFVATELHKVFSPWLWHADTAETTQQAVRDKLALRFAELDRHFAAHDWLALDRYTVADAYAYTILNWANFLHIELAPYPRLRAYLERVAARGAGSRRPEQVNHPASKGHSMIDLRTAPYAALLLRISLGAMFIAHSLWLKLFVFTLPGTAQFFGSIGLPPVLAYLVR